MNRPGRRATVSCDGRLGSVAAVTLKWAQALGKGDPDKLLPLYSDDAVLLGTLSPTVRADRVALRDYFMTVFKLLPGLKVAFGDQLIRVYAVRPSTPATTLSLSLRMERPRPCLRATPLRT